MTDLHTTRRWVNIHTTIFMVIQQWSCPCDDAYLVTLIQDIIFLCLCLPKPDDYRQAEQLSTAIWDGLPSSCKRWKRHSLDSRVHNDGCYDLDVDGVSIAKISLESSGYYNIFCCLTFLYFILWHCCTSAFRSSCCVPWTLLSGCC